MKVTELIYQLLDMCREHNVNPNDVEVNMREDWDSDCETINFVFEDLYDKETNKILTDIVVLAYDNEEGGSQ